MVDLGSEVSSKIRLAIKAKLHELKAYVDEELPDYIMVMVANKKDGEQMKKDLGLFLNDHTDDFVDWLQKVLAKLERVTLGGTSSSGVHKEGTKDSKKVKVKKKKKTDTDSKKAKVKKLKKMSEESKDKREKQKEEPSVRRRSTSMERRLKNMASKGHERDGMLERRASRTEEDFRPRTTNAGRRDQRRTPPPPPSRRPAPPYGKSQEQDYDPQKLLKTAIVAVSRERKRDEDKRSEAPARKRASGERHMSMDKDSAELDAVFAKRARLSKAMKEGRLDERKIEEINRSLHRGSGVGNKISRKEDEPRGRQRPERTPARKKSASSSREERPSKRNREAEKRPLKVQSLSPVASKAKPPLPPEKLAKADLRHSLGTRKAKVQLIQRRDDKHNDEEEEELLKEAKAMMANPKASGITIQIANRAKDGTVEPATAAKQEISVKSSSAKRSPTSSVVNGKRRTAASATVKPGELKLRVENNTAKVRYMNELSFTYGFCSTQGC